MTEFADHPLFFLLSAPLKGHAAAALKELYREWDYDSPNDMYDDVRERVRDGCLVPALEKAADEELRRWADLTPSTEFVTALAHCFWWTRTAAAPYLPPKATEAQLRILTDYQQERGMDVDLTPLFPLLTTNIADCLVKGLVVISEVLRSTGQRRMHPRDVRQAIRRYLAENPTIIADSRPSRAD